MTTPPRSVADADPMLARMAAEPSIRRSRRREVVRYCTADVDMRAIPHGLSPPYLIVVEPGSGWMELAKNAPDGFRCTHQRLLEAFVQIATVAS